MTTLRADFLAALKSGASRKDLVGIVERHKSHGVSQRETYDVLESIRKELGCDINDENPNCERLEAVMDRVWGYCSKAEAIWEKSLSEVRGD